MVEKNLFEKKRRMREYRAREERRGPKRGGEKTKEKAEKQQEVPQKGTSRKIFSKRRKKAQGFEEEEETIGKKTQNMKKNKGNIGDSSNTSVGGKMKKKMTGRKENA